MDTQGKLEIVWYGKEKDVKVEPRILIEDKTKSFSYRPNQTSIFGETFSSDNILIHGDNLLALKALEQSYSGKVKCVYIDPPYNTGNAFSTYDDNLEHSIWLSLMKPRIEIIHTLLAENGTLWISIDDDERDYLKILCDEIFGRDNFVTSCIWQKKGTRSNDATWFSDNHDYILVFAKNKAKWKINKLPRPDSAINGYSNPDNDPRGVWASGPCHAKTPNEKDIYEVITPSGRKVLPPPGTSWRFSKQHFQELVDENHIWFGEKGDNIPRYKRFLTEVQDGFVPLTIWPRDEVGDNQEAKKEVKAFNSDVVFPTPKPERLLQRVLKLATNEGDLVLDSFLGSATTCAVAQKMNRKWIGIEMTDVAYTHDIPRLVSVISGKDKGGITKNEKYNGGGGFHFYELAPSLLKIDSFGQAIINPKYNPEMLASAVAKHEGFIYQPDSLHYWKQSTNGTNSFLFVTTNHITRQIIDSIRSELRDDQFLQIVCKSFDENALAETRNISLKKIPQSLLKNCEFGVENYNLNIVCPPDYFDEEDS
jgi:adenine-specific DNA-methyltransferase